MSAITTHVLDTSIGRPARGIEVILERRASRDAAASTGASGVNADVAAPIVIGRGVTDDDGRVRDLAPAGAIVPGVYQLRFATGAYFAESELDTFYSEVVISFVVHGGTEHYHVPLLLSPFGYSTYRGS